MILCYYNILTIWDNVSRKENIEICKKFILERESEVMENNEILILFENGIEFLCNKDSLFKDENNKNIWLKDLSCGDKILFENELLTIFDIFEVNNFESNLETELVFRKEIEDYEVFTDIGWVPIKNVMITNKLLLYEVEFENISVICAHRHIFIDKFYNEQFAFELREGQEILSENGIERVKTVRKLNKVDNCYDLELDGHHLYYANGVLSHNSNLMLNIAGRQALKGKNVIIFTLEMSEFMTAQRIDAHLTGLDINRIYIDQKKNLVTELEKVKNIEGRGNLFIKEFPTGAASTNTFRTYLYEMQARNVNFDMLFCDYLGLMKPEYRNDRDAMYEMGKQTSVELRGLSFEFNMPIMSVSQLNRSGSRMPLSDVDMMDIAEAYAIAHTSDFMIVLGIDEERSAFENEICYKIIKNRLGGRVGEIDKFYIDPRSLKMYDSSELEKWMDDAVKSGCKTRNPLEKRN